MIPPIKIDVGANLSGLSIGFDKSLSLMDRFADDMDAKTGSMWDRLTEGLASGPIDLVDQLSTVMGGLAFSLENLDGPLSLLPERLQLSAQGMAGMLGKGSEMLAIFGDVRAGIDPLLSLFPSLQRIATKAFRVIGRAVMGALLSPIGLVAGAVAGLGVLFVTHIDTAAKITANLGNRFVNLYNKSVPFRNVVEFLVREFQKAKLTAGTFFDVVGIGFTAMMKAGQALKTGNIFAFDGIFSEAKAKYKTVVSDFNADLKDIYKDSASRLTNGLDNISVEDVKNTGFFKAGAAAGDWLKSKWASLMQGPDSVSDPEALRRMSEFFQNAIKPIAGEMEKVFTPFEKLQNAISTATDKYRNAFLTGDSKGATAALSLLDNLNTKMSRLKDTMSRPLGLDKLPSLPFTKKTNIRRSMEVRERIQEIEIEIKANPQGLETITKLQKELAALRKEAEKLGYTMPDSWLKMEESSRKTSTAISDMVKDMKKSLANIAADTITNLFSGSDKEAIAAINEELRENKKILSDTGATKEARDAAKARIEILKEEMAAEKARGNIIVQSTALILDAAKKHIQAKLAEAMASAVGSEARKGLPGLITAGIAIAGFSALFASKIPKLAKGGILSGETAFIGGEYAGANINPEVVAPLSDLTDHIRKALGPRATQAAAPVVIGGDLETRVDGDDLYVMMTLKHQQSVLNTSINKFVDP